MIHPRREGGSRAPALPLVVVAVLVGILLLAPGAAHATGSGTDRSEIIDVLPPTDVVQLEVLDGDQQLRITVADGHRVEVPGYQGEPWLVFDEDGTLRENVSSPAGWLNRTADGLAPVPAEASPDAEPNWREIATTRTHRWHDHRVHDMGEGRGLASGQIKGWAVDLVVDGTPTEVQGRLDRLPTDPWLPWAALALLVAGVGITWALPAPLKRSRLLAESAAAVVTVVSVAGVVGASVPGVADFVHLGLAVAGAAVLLASRFVPALGRPPSRLGLVLLGGTGLVAASAVAQAPVLVHPIVLGALPDPVTRAGVALVAGAAVAVAGVLTWTGLGTTGPGSDAA